MTSKKEKEPETASDFWPCEGYITANTSFYSEHMASRKKAIAAVKALAGELYRLGWSELKMEYAGYGDSMSECNVVLVNDDSEDRDLHAAPARELPPEETPHSIEQKLLELLPIGFENEEGGSGVLVITTSDKKIKVMHDMYYTETKSEEMTF